MTGKTKGFTLIELMVVVSIISIISSTILVSLSNAKIKADNIKTLNHIESYIKAFELSRAPDGQFVHPAINGAFACLGSGYPGGTCWQNGLSTSEDPTVNAALAQYFPTMSIDTTINNFHGSHIMGYIYRCGNPASGRCDTIDIGWMYKGNAPNFCYLSGLTVINAVSFTGSTYCEGWYPYQPEVDQQVP